MNASKLPHQLKPHVIRLLHGWFVTPMRRYHWAQQQQYLAARAWCEQQNHKEHNCGRNH